MNVRVAFFPVFHVAFFPARVKSASLSGVAGRRPSTPEGEEPPAQDKEGSGKILEEHGLAHR
jgi:hypothetical protein